MYCSIEDAWGSDFNKEIKSTESEKPTEFKKTKVNITEKFDNYDSEKISERQLYDQYLKLKNKFNNDENNKVCDAVQKHIASCPTCQARYMKSSIPSINNFSLNIPSTESIMNKLNENSDAVTLFLICLLILLIIKLFNKN